MELEDCVKNSIGRGLSDIQTKSLLALAVIKNFSGGDVIIRQFDQSTDLMVLLDGRVRIFGFHGKELREVGPGSVFGEVSLVDKQPRSASVRSAGHATVATFDAKKLIALLESDTEMAATLYKNIAHVLSSRLRQATIEVDGLMGYHPTF